MHLTPSRPRRAMLLSAAVLTASALLLTGCGRGGDAKPAASSGATIDDKPAKGTVQLWAQGADGDKLPDMIAEFKKTNPDVDIKLTKLPADQFASKMTAAITAGTVPDLNFAYTEDQAALLNTGGFDPVPDGLAKKDDFFPAIWNNSIVDGTQYGVPWYTYANMFIYRTDLAQQAGVTEAPKTWAEQKTFGEKLKAAGRVASTTSTEQSGLFKHLLPVFEKKTGIKVRVVALGTGQALDVARRGDADVVFVHAKSRGGEVPRRRRRRQALPRHVQRLRADRARRAIPQKSAAARTSWTR